MLLSPLLGGSHLSASQGSQNPQPQRSCVSRQLRLQHQQQPAQPSRWFATSGSTAEVALYEQHSQRAAEQGTASTSGRGLPTGGDQAARAIVEMDTELVQQNGMPKYAPTFIQLLVSCMKQHCSSSVLWLPIS